MPLNPSTQSSSSITPTSNSLILTETMSITETTEMNIDGYEMDQNDEMDQNSLDQVKTNQNFVFDRSNKRKDFQS